MMARPLLQAIVIVTFAAILLPILHGNWVEEEAQTEPGLNPWVGNSCETNDTDAASPEIITSKTPSPPPTSSHKAVATATGTPRTFAARALPPVTSGLDYGFDIQITGTYTVTVPQFTALADVNLSGASGASTVASITSSTPTGTPATPSVGMLAPLDPDDAASRIEHADYMSALKKAKSMMEEAARPDD